MQTINRTRQSKDPAPIVATWSLMLADLDPVVAKAAVIKVCRESDFFPSVARIVATAEELDPRIEKTSHRCRSVGGSRTVDHSFRALPRTEIQL